MPSQDGLPGRLGPYRLLERIGEGGMGVVHLARDREGRMVALKVLHPRVAEEANSRRRLASEVETMRRVRSPFVAAILDANITGKFPYIVTKFVPGRTLEDLVRQEGPLPAHALERLAFGLAEALTAVHAAGVVHRDLKPGNVMLVGSDPVVIDFGIAQSDDSTRLTQTGMFMGTPGYLAPEVIEGQPSSEASDVHSWGGVMAFAATGRPPFGTGSFETIFFRIVQGKVDLDGLPGPLLPLVAAALARDPQRRPSATWLSAQSAALHLVGALPVRNVAAILGPDLAGPMPHAPGMAAPGMAAPGMAAQGMPAQAMPGMPSAYHPHPQTAPGLARHVPQDQNAFGQRHPAPFPAVLPDVPGSRNGQSARYPPGTKPFAPGPEDFADILPPVSYQRDTPEAPPAAPGRLGDKNSASPPEAPAPSSSSERRQAEPIRPHGFLSLAVMVIAVALSVILPIAGMLASLAVIILLRAADRAQSALMERRSVRGARASDLFVVIVTAPWAVARALLTTALLAPLALGAAAIAAAVTFTMVRTDALTQAGGYAAGALIAFYAVGPGSKRPRRQLSRLFSAVLRSQGSSAVGGIVMGALAAAFITAALSQTPLYWPVVTGMIPHLPTLSSVIHSMEHSLHNFAVRSLHVNGIPVRIHIP